MRRVYFDIDEETAERAHDMMSLGEYRRGSRTAVYVGRCNKVYDIVDAIESARPSESERAARIALSYARRLADNMNAADRIGCMCPSVLVSGAGNFPAGKKRRQVAAMDRNTQEFLSLEERKAKLEKILSGAGADAAGGENSMEKLEAWLAKVTEAQELMRGVNAYYRRRGTLDGCPLLAEGRAREIVPKIEAAVRSFGVPFAPFMLANNGARIRETKKRIERLRKAKKAGAVETRQEAAGMTVRENSELTRLQVFFDEKPDEDVRDLLKGCGFKWSPDNGCWQRKLTDNARRSLDCILESLKQKAED